MSLNSPVRILPGAQQEDYKEPKSFETLRDECAKACEAIGHARDLEEARDLAGVLSTLTVEAITRFNACHAALMHFAKHGVSMANMKMSLAKDGRHKEPAGGVWMNGLQAANLTPNESIFYAAIDAVGRKSTEDSLIADFKRVQDGAALMKEKSDALSNKALQGPTGGPVGPRLQ